ncbi:MAG TPA: HEPN domain-containing protein [Candidatus Aenigmarchaeota archaeon]|nr:HEPN domain-containing protein [Candidatus Aenigmarchaeota archaeon]
MVRIGHPIVFNFIREGIPVFDKDIFVPIKRLLQMGEIKPSREAVEKYMERAPRRLKRVETAKLYMVAEDCYYAMLESAQAVLMFFGRHPPRPEEAPLELKRTLVKMGFIKPELVEWLEGVIKVRKDIEHKKRNEMKGEELDEWIKRAKKFVKEMQKVLVKIEILKRESIVEKSYAIMLETITTLLNAMNKPPKRKEDIPKLFEEHIVKPGLVSEKYLKVLNELDRIRKIAMEGKITDISKSDILMNREYVRKFIREAGKILKSLEKEK